MSLLVEMIFDFEKPKPIPTLNCRGIINNVSKKYS